ncbi:translation factor GTPase family protein [Coprococcus sp. B2-R-112]|uniref:translation factor GTPase family protein n=1 Tax=Coprococcus sp. B2-R-112 TaxID=2949662 RepID=UPI00202E4064|nr:TetM/TetW/TetO/TetS family tetracycline resistance ribosomal protection protein [Coprococcus sp. B2-R-112]MCM0662450.1 TetM/TetW/TetO/TetS family tetracycline resistance ribosomal protection protein [Coprococcus sp. B2-R-112]
MSKTVLGILAHVDAGKTTLSESILYLTGSIRKLGRVDNKDAFLDTYSLERERGITIFSKQAEIEMRGRSYTLLDTPGHVDFSAEMERTLQVLDYAVLVISGADGVQGHTQTLWRLLARYEVPTFIFVNKMDQNGTDRRALMEEIRQRLGDSCIDFSEEADARNENLAMCDEKVLEAYLEKGTVTDEQVRRMITGRKVFPCFFGSALKLTGVQELLDGIAKWTEEKQYPETFGARVFKIARDAQGGRLTYMKITGGSLKVKAQLRGPIRRRQEAGGEAEDTLSGKDTSAGEWEEKVNQIRIYNGTKFETVDAASAGTVCAVTGLTQTQAGDGLGAEAEQVVPLLEPVLTYRVELPEGSDLHKVLHQLRQLEEEEPELHIVWDDISGQVLVQLMGEIQTEILQQMIHERFGLEVKFGAGQIVYKETIAAPVEGVGHFEPLRHYAEVHLLMEPLEAGSGLVFDTVCSENMLDRNWQRLILTHLEEKVHRGVLMGAPITDMRITLIAGRAHQKHTEGGDFRQATYRAVRQGLQKAESVLLEPYYRFRLELPQRLVGHAMTDIEKMSGRFELGENEGETAVLTGMAPVSEMREYQKDVAAYTGGTGRLFCTMAGYYPCHNTEEVLVASAYDPERDLANPTGSVFCAHGAGFVVPWYEVEDYMHLEGAGLDGETAGAEDEDAVMTAKAKAARSRSIAPSLADDKELEAIFVRTYGEIKRRKPQKERTFRGADTSYSEVSGSSGKLTGGLSDSSGKGSWRGEKKQQENRRQATAQESYLLVDGYNIIFAWEDLHELSEHSMDAARNKLMETLSNYQGYTSQRVILVFDAYKVEGFPGEVTKWHNIDVVFTKEAETADQYIEKTAHAIGRKYKVTVATSDGLEQVIIRSQGCLLMSARELRQEIERIKVEIRREHLERNQERGNYLLNYLPEEEAERMEAIRQGLISADEADADKRRR